MMFRIAAFVCMMIVSLVANAANGLIWLASPQRASESPSGLQGCR